ncbi:hypothetical protein [Variovorax paradoxus]|uniref:hypothetical protein n=1 Tax=Variovorax paradoxus TaxID=34073 RepID=UPI00278976A3|nr:hypothetical protein [Variovorax paradoxus]MDP9933667.1 hypothetical protein [Variovorax paradoxus]
MKIVAEFSLLPNGQKYPHLAAINEDGSVCESITLTLLDFVVELHPPAVFLFEELLENARNGKYVPANPALADFSVNEKLVWVRPLDLQRGELRISNENTFEYSVDTGEPQSFSIEFFYSVRRHWEEFLRLVKEEGDQKWLGEKLELNV